jgi:hypothetical protein
MSQEQIEQRVIGAIQPLNSLKVFTHQEALDLLPLLLRISEKTKKALNNYNAQLAYFKNRSDKSQELQEKINSEIQTWSEKIRRLGAIPVQFLKVKVPSEQGFFYWEYPSTSLYLQ